MNQYFQDWNYIQFGVLFLGFFLLACFVFIVIKGKFKFSRSRVVTVLLFSLLTLAMIWTSGGGKLSAKREIVIVAACDSNMNQFKSKYQQVLRDTDAVSLLLLASKESSSNCQEGIQALIRTINPSIRVSVKEVEVNSGTNFEEVINRYKELTSFSVLDPFRFFIDLISVETFVLMHDRASSTWKGLQNLNFKALPQSSEVFIVQDQSSNSFYNLNVNLKGNDSHGTSLGNSEQLIELVIRGGNLRDPNLIDSVKVKLCAQFNDSSEEFCTNSDQEFIRSLGDNEAYRYKTPSESDPEKTRVLLADLAHRLGGADLAHRLGGLQNKKVKAGWNRLSLQLTLLETEPDQSEGKIPFSSHILTEKTVYFKSSELSGATVILDGQDVTSKSWLDRDNLNLESLFSAITMDRDDLAKPYLTRLIGLKILAKSSDSAGSFDCLFKKADIVSSSLRIKKCISVSSSVILVEPGVSLLNQVDESVKNLLDKGGAVLVSSPPKRSSTADNIDWLPAWRSDTTIHTSRNILAIGDCSGLAKEFHDPSISSALDKNAETSMGKQDKLYAALIRKLQSRAGIKSQVDERGSEKIIRFESQNNATQSFEMKDKLACLGSTGFTNQNTPQSILHFSQIDWRTHALAGQGLGDNVLGFNPNDLYPGSVLLLFSTQSPELSSDYSGGSKFYDFSGKDLSGLVMKPLEANILARLKEQGVKVVVVELPTHTVLAENAISGKTWDEKVADLKGPLNLIDLVENTAEPIEQTVDKILQLIDSHHVNFTTEFKGFSKSMDPRRLDSVNIAPFVVTPLIASPVTRPKTTYPALLAKVEYPEVSNSDLIYSRRYKNGHVLALGYSLYDPRAWVSDSDPRHDHAIKFIEEVCSSTDLSCIDWLKMIGKSSNADQPSTTLGIQRVIDVLDYTPNNLPSEESGLILESLEMSSGNDVVTLSFSFKDPSYLDTPLIDFNSSTQAGIHCNTRAVGNKCPMFITELDLARSKVKYHFQTYVSTGLNLGDYIIEFGDQSLLVSMKLAASDTPESQGFNNVAKSQGAMTFNALFPPAIISAAPFSAIVFLFFSVLLLSPIVRPWIAFSEFWRRRSNNWDSADVGFDASTVTQRLSNTFPRYEASRKSGDPAWTRYFSPGDSLSRAKITDLIAFTSIGKSLGLIKKPPRVRLREIGDSFDVEIGVDDSASLNYPKSSDNTSAKNEAAKSIVFILASVIVSQGGRWSLRGLRSGITVGLNSDFQKESIDEIFEELSQSTILRKEDGMNFSGQHEVQKILISDLLYSNIEEYQSYISQSGGGVIILYDPEQASELGLRIDVKKSVIYDRSGFEKADLDDAVSKKVLDGQYFLKHGGAKVASISIDQSSLGVAEELLNSGVMEVLKR